MENHKVLLIFLAVAIGFGVLAVVHVLGSKSPAERGQIAVALEPEAAPPVRLHGKMGPPAGIHISLAAGERASDPVTVNVTASSQVPVGSGAISLTMREGGAAAGETVVLWSAAPSDYVDETMECSVGALPEGPYCLAAVFEFTPDGDPAQAMAVSCCLYLDVQADAIFASNVSFEHLKRMELLEELEQRVLAETKPALAAADRTAKTREVTSLKVRNPGFVARRIEEIKANDPNVGRRIEQLNQMPARTESSSDPAETGQMMGEVTAPSYRLDAQ